MDDASELFYGADGQMNEFFPYNAQPADADYWGNADGTPEFDSTNRLYMDAWQADGGADNAPVAQTIPDFDRTYTLTLTKTVAGAVPITIFGANQFLTAVNFGLPAVVTATVGESSYQEMLFETQTAPFVISGFRITSSFAPQLDQVMTILKRTGNGQRCSYPLQIGNYFSAFQFQAGIREVYPYNITMEGTTQISFNLLGGVDDVTTITFFVGKRVGFGNTLHNRPVREVSVQKLPFVAKQQLSLSPSTVQALKG